MDLKNKLLIVAIIATISTIVHESFLLTYFILDYKNEWFLRIAVDSAYFVLACASLVIFMGIREIRKTRISKSH